MSIEYSEGFDAGLEAAARLLEATAQDYDQMGAQVERDIGRLSGNLFAARMQQAQAYRSKADLLRGQALRIRERK